jgi:hypothetical protein
MSGAYTQGLSYNSSVLSHPKTFLSLFPNRSRSILRPSGCKEWTTLSRHHQLSDEELLAAVDATTDDIRGARSGTQTRFANLDIDTGSLYHNELSLLRLRQVLASVGLKKTKLYRSSESGGWHLYCFFSSWVDSAQVQQSLSAWLTNQSFLLGLGQLEVFPQPVTPKSLGHGLRLPLQRGFAWLTDTADLEARREDMTAEAAVSRFVRDLLESGNNWAQAQALIRANLSKQAADKHAPQIEDKEDDGFSDLFTRSGLKPEVYQKGEKYWFEGLSAFGQRHDAILSVGHYLWYRPEAPLPGARNAGRREEAIRYWLETKHNGFSQTINRGRWRPIEEDTRRACHWENKAPRVIVHEPYKLTERFVDRLVAAPALTPERCQKANDRREQEARDKIRQALAVLLEEGRRPTIKGLSRLSGCHRDTVRRHSDIWCISRLSEGTGECSSFGGDCPSVMVVLGSEKEILNSVLCEGDSGDLWVDDSLSEAEIIELSEWPRKAKNPWWDRDVAAVVLESEIRSFPDVRSFGMKSTAKPEILVDSVALPIVQPPEKQPRKFHVGVFREGTVVKKKRLAARQVRISLFSFVFVILLVCSRIFLREQLGFSPCLSGSRFAGAKYLPHVPKEIGLQRVCSDSGEDEKNERDQSTIKQSCPGGSGNDFLNLKGRPLQSFKSGSSAIPLLQTVFLAQTACNLSSRSTMLIATFLPRATAIRSSILSECPSYSALSSLEITEPVVPTMSASSS